MNKLTSIGLAAAIAASGCGSRTELYDMHSGSNGVEPTDSGAGGSAIDSGGDAGGTGGSDSGIKTGTITIRNKGTLDPLIHEKQGAIQARFEITADNIEMQRIDEICLKVKAVQCDAMGISAPISLFEEGKDKQLAAGKLDEYGGWYGDLCFKFTTPYNLFQGQSKTFRIVSDLLAPCCHSSLDTYLEKPENLKATGALYGLPAHVDNKYGEKDEHSSVDSWWGKFNVFYSASSLDIPVGTKDAACMDLRISNCLPQDVEIKDWIFGIEFPNGDGLLDTKDLVDDNLTQTNLNSLKLITQNGDGTPGPTIFGPNELNPLGSDVSQMIMFGGTNTISKGSSVSASLVFNVEDNQTLAGNQVRCVLKNLATPGAPKVTIGGQQLEADKIIPAEDITGNIHTITAEDFPCIHVEPANVPVGEVLPKGSANVNFACWNFTNACNPTMLRFLKVTRYGVGSNGDLDSFRLYEGTTPVSLISTINKTDGTIVFNNLSVPFNAGEITRICAHADVSNSATSGQHGLQITTATDDITLQPAKKIDGQFPAQGPIFFVAQ